MFITSHPGFSFVSQRSLFRVASFGNISTCSSFEMFVSLAENVLLNGAFCPRYLIQACYGRKERATHITTALLTFTPPCTTVRVNQLRTLNQADPGHPVRKAKQRASACSAPLSIPAYIITPCKRVKCCRMARPYLVTFSFIAWSIN